MEQFNKDTSKHQKGGNMSEISISIVDKNLDEESTNEE